MAGLMVVLAHVTARDSAGFYTSPSERFSTQTYALTSEGMQIGDIRGEGADWALDALDATVRVRAAAPDGDPCSSASPREAGRRPLPHPGRARGDHRRPRRPVQLRLRPPWRQRRARRARSRRTSGSRRASGRGTQALTWKPDGRPLGRGRDERGRQPRASTADVSVGAKSGAVLPVGFVLLGLGLVGLAVLGRRADLARGARATGPAGGVTAIALVGAGDEHGPRRVVQDAGRHAAQQRGGQRRAAARAEHDRRGVELVGARDQRAKTAPEPRTACGRASNPAAPASSAPSAAIASAASRVAVSMSETASADDAAGQREQRARRRGLERRPDGHDDRGTRPEQLPGVLDRRAGVLGAVVAEEDGSHARIMTGRGRHRGCGKPAGVARRIADGRPREPA